MAAPTPLTTAPEPTLPGSVNLHTDELRQPRFTPRELRLVQEHFGRSFTTIVGDEDSDDKFLVFAWLKLRRDGHDVSLTDMDDVVIAVTTGAEDPTNAPPRTDSQRSATGGT